MGIICAVTTFEPLATMRFDLLRRTVESMKKAFPSSRVFVFDNGSRDESWEATVHLAIGGDPWGGGLPFLLQGGGNRTPGDARHGVVSVMIGMSLRSDDIVVMSDDDMEWKEGAGERLLEAWRHAPPKLQIICGLLEPDYPWSKPLWAVQLGKERALVRKSAPGAAWTIRADLLKRMPSIERCFGYDTKACAALREMGFEVAQMDLATHIGAESSTHDNDPRRHARPLDRERWGV